MTVAAAHLVILPVLLPLAAGALLLPLSERRHALKGAISIASAWLLLACAILLAIRVGEPQTYVYPLGDWPARFGIVLVADQLSALMVLLSATLGVSAVLFSSASWDKAGAHFHSLVQFLLAGVNGAFLTGDLFNLFVFFELFLAASYGLALHGGGIRRVRASVHYIVLNLAASLLFLVGVSLMYGIAGTLNMADLATELPRIAKDDRALLEIGAATLGVAFLVKAGVWPLGFWLSPTYAAVNAPAAALFSILSKVGVYAAFRVWYIVFGGTGGELLMYGGMATVVFAVIGMLSSQGLGRIAGFSVLASSGTLLSTAGLQIPAATAAAFYYLTASTLGLAALFLLVELMERSREPGADIVAVTAEEYGLASRSDEPDDQPGIAIPGTMAALGLAFTCVALGIAGLPPLPAFVGKFAILASLVAADSISSAAWLLLALILLSSLASIVSLGRAGVRVFWLEGRSIPRVRPAEIVPIAALLAASIALTIAAGPAMRYMASAAHSLHAPAGYIEGVMRPQ
jgi:multicomponent K+:H+ antiporter subunit D